MTSATRRRKPKHAAPDSEPVHRESVAMGERLNDAVRPILILVVQLQQLRRERRPPPELAYKQIKSQLSQRMRRVEALGLSPADVADVKYALAAFIDEFMQLDAGPLRDFWQGHLLQLELFGETKAGEGFFERLERIKSDGRMASLRVYYLCLLFGFHGIYGQHGELERENLITGVQQALGQKSDLLSTFALAPNGPRPDEPGADSERNRLLQWFAIAAAAMSVLWYVGLVFAVDAKEQTLTDTLRAAYEDLTAGLVLPVN